VAIEELMRSRLGNGPVSNFFKELASNYEYIVQAIEHEDNMFESELLCHLEVTKVLVQKLKFVQPWEITISKEPFRSSRTNVQIRAKEILESPVDFGRLRESKRLSFGTVRVSWPCVSVTAGLSTISSQRLGLWCSTINERSWRYSRKA
jgi:hypothetical protein